MRKIQYRKIVEWVKKHPLLKNFAIIFDCVATKLFALCYACFLFFLGMQQIKTCILCILCSGGSFVLFSSLRTKQNTKRPYEIEGFEPLIQKKTAGKSFPSRHVFSACLIGMIIMQFFFLQGVVLLGIGFLFGGVRVLLGVHSIEDVIGGALIGCVSGALICFVCFF